MDSLIAVVLMATVFVILPLGGIIVSYFLPTIVAKIRKKHDFTKILLINIFLGWASPAWIYICVCAFLDNPPETVAPAPVA